MSLNDTLLKGLKAKEKSYKLFDGQGLYIFISVAGAKLWRIKYRLNGKEKILSIGQYPTLGLKEARARLAEVKEQLANDINPRQVKKIPVITIFSTVADEWLNKQSSQWVDTHTSTVVARLNKYILPYIGGMQLETITPQDVLALAKKLEVQSKFETASRVMGICSQVFRHGVICGLCTSDPCRDLRGALITKRPVPRAAITEPQEAGRLMSMIKAYPWHTLRNAMLWSAYTFGRPIEVRRAEWVEIDFDKKEWRIPAGKMKMRREHRVPLPTQCMAVLEAMQGMNDKWIFPSPKAGRCLSEAGVLSALRSMGYEKHQMCAHGFRAMASTLLNELGYRPDLIEKSLAHGDTDKVRAAYNRALYMDERRIMMQAWADYLDQLCEQQS